MSGDQICGNCGNVIEDFMNFCPACGSQLGGIKSKISTLKKQVEINVKNKVNTVKSNLDTRISSYLLKLDNDPSFRVAGKEISEPKKQSLRNALLNFQNKIKQGDVDNSEFDEWLNDLELRLDEENCVICFQKLAGSSESIVVCKYCQSGGHYTHITSWVNQHQFCPLCREKLNSRDLVQVSTRTHNE